MNRRLIFDRSIATDPEVGAWLAAMEDCRRRTLEVLGVVSEGDLDREAPGNPNTIGSLLYHIAAIEADWLFTDILQGTKPWPEELFPWEVRDERGRLTEIRGLSMSQHLDRLASVRAIVLDALHDMDREDLHRARSLPDYHVTPEWVLHHLMQHEAEHRAQIDHVRTADSG